MRVILFPNPKPPHNLCIRIPAPVLVANQGEAAALAQAIERGQICGDIPCESSSTRARYLERWKINNPRQGQKGFMAESDFAQVGPHYVVDMDDLPDRALFDAWVWKGGRVEIDDAKARDLGLR